MNLNSLLEKRRSGQAGTLLKGSDVPAGTKFVTITVKAIRESPDSFNAPAIIDFEKPVYGKSGWATNVTNLKAITKKYGDDPGNLVGQKLRLEVVTVRNPQSGDLVLSLVFNPKP